MSVSLRKLVLMLVLVWVLFVSVCGKDFAKAEFDNNVNNVNNVNNEMKIENKKDSKVVYGVDNRKDVYEVTGLYANLATQSIVGVSAVLPASFATTITAYLTQLPDSYRLGANYNLCSDQKFFHDPSVAQCSGTLIAPDRVLTAGHCFTYAECIGQNMLLSFYATGRDASGYPTFPTITTSADLYKCIGVYTVQDPKTLLDFAVVHLDRPVNNKYTPVPITTSESPLSLNQQVVVIGFGSAIPAKIDDGGVVIQTQDVNDVYFVATTDTFQGNSGSGVFSTDGTLVGILTRGQNDYVKRNGATCKEVNVLDSSVCNCGEIVVYAYHANSVIDCTSDSDCVSQTYYKSTRCQRNCAAGATTCTGLCIPVNFISEVSCGSVVNGTTYTAPNAFASAGGDHVFNITVPFSETLTIDACGLTWDGQLTVVNANSPSTTFASCDSNCGCSDATSPKLIVSLTAGTYMVILDGPTEGDAGEYSISFECSNVQPGSSQSNTRSTTTSPSCTPSPQTLSASRTGSKSPTQSNSISNSGSRSMSITTTPSVTASRSVTASNTASPTASKTPKPDYVVSGNVTCGSNVTGTTLNAPDLIRNPSGEHQFLFEVTDSDYKVTFNTCLSTFDTFVRVWDGTFDTEIAQCDDCGGCGNKAVFSVVLNPGLYAVMIEGHNTSEGNYTIGVTCEPKACTDSSICQFSSVTCTNDFWQHCPVKCDTCNGPTPSVSPSPESRASTPRFVASILLSVIFAFAFAL